MNDDWLKLKVCDGKQ